MITVGLSIVLVFVGLYFFTATDVIITLLEILIVAEIVRMLANFMLDTDHKVNIRYAIDGSVIYVLRELYITLTAFQQNPELWVQIAIYMAVIAGFVVLRTVTITQFEMILGSDKKLNKTD
jgi:uncharacterized membrane protein (DUF373 family)